MKLVALLVIACAAPLAAQDLVVRGRIVHPVAGAPIQDGVVVVRGGKIVAVGPAADVTVPAGLDVLTAEVVVPGLIDAHTVVGLAGWLNTDHDQDQLEDSTAMQPELRAIDAYNPREPLIAWIRGFGVTTIHTGHAPGAVISGQTLIAKTRGRTVDEAVFVPFAAIAATLGEDAIAEDDVPGNRSKAVAILRQELVRAQAYIAGQAGEDPPPRDLHLDALAALLRREVPLMVTAHRAHDLMSALRVAQEFELSLWLDGAAEAGDLIEEIRAADVAVLLHPPMQRAWQERENLSMATPTRLRDAGIRFALQSGYESYVPKTRVVLFEAAIAAAYGLGFEDALRAITLDAARILGIDGRVGSLEVGKDGDLALYDGDPFETMSHCIGVVIEGEVVSTEVR